MPGGIKHCINLLGFSAVHVFSVVIQPVDSPGTTTMETAHAIIGIGDFIRISLEENIAGGNIQFSQLGMEKKDVSLLADEFDNSVFSILTIDVSQVVF